MPIQSNVDSKEVSSDSIVLRDAGTVNIADRRVNRDSYIGYNNIVDIHLQIAVLPQPRAILHSVLPDRFERE
jgi:hypothetical protein